MIHAYREIYLGNAQAVLGDAFDYAVNTCGIPGGEFIKLFVVSSISKRMENGEAACILGKSGIEIAQMIIEETTERTEFPDPEESFSRSPEYWIGWAVAYYQWYSARSYGEIFSALSFEDLESMYVTLHEADVTKFAEIADARTREHFPETALKRLRTICGYSQAELSRQSGVSLRSIQMYEQHNKDINKASAETLYRLARVFGCKMEDLLEK
jgi:DNA-binding XRE family transcriptional regulator